MANDDPEDPRRRATPQVGWTRGPRDPIGGALSRSAITPMPAKLKAAQAAQAQQAPASPAAASKITEKDLPARSVDRPKPSAREDRGDRYSDVGTNSVEVLTPPPTRVSANLPSPAGEGYDLEGPLAPHLAWLEDDGRAELLGHLKRGDHARTLAMLASAAKRYPRIVSITRATQLVERAAIARLTKRIGDFDAIAVVAGRPGPSHEAISLAALIDGARAIDEVVRMSSLPRLRTLELLDDLIRRGAVEVRDPYVQSSSGKAPSPRKPTPYAHPAMPTDARPASVPPQRLGAGGGPSPFGGLRGKKVAPASAKTTESPIPREARDGRFDVPDLEDDPNARVTIPGHIDVPYMNAPTPSPTPAVREDDGPSIAIEPLGPASAPSSSPDSRPADSAREEGLPAVLAFGLLSLPVRSKSPSSPRTPTAASGVASTETPSAAVSGGAPTEPNPTLVTPREPEAERPRGDRVKMETLKSAPDPEVLLAAERAERAERADRAERAERGGIEVRSARKRDFDGTLESTVDAPPVPALPIKPEVDAKAARPRSEPPASATSSIAPSVKSEPARPQVEVRTIVRETTPRWFVPAGVAVGLALVGSGIAVWLSLRNASELPPTRDPVAESQAAPDRPTKPSATAAAEVPSQAAPLPGVVHVRIDASPRAARVTLDKVLLTAHPIDEVIPRDGKEHEVRVELVGYEPFKKTFVADGEVILTVNLKPAPMPNVVTAPPPPTPLTPSTAPTPPPTKPEDVYPTP